MLIEKREKNPNQLFSNNRMSTRLTPCSRQIHTQEQGPQKRANVEETPIPNTWCEMAPAFTLREVEFPWRSSSRRQNLVALCCQPLLHGRTSGWAVTSCTFSPWLGPSRFGAGAGRCCSCWSCFSSPGSAAVHFTSRQLKDCYCSSFKPEKVKTFLSGPTKLS